MPRHQRYFSGSCLFVLCLVQLCLAPLPFSDLNSLGFVSASWDHRQATEGQVSRRSGRQRQADSGQQEPDSKAEAKQFTVAVKRAATPKNLIETLDWVVDGRIFDFILASAAYTRLAYFTKRRDGLQPSDWDSPVLLRLHARAQEMALEDQLNAQASANILWSLARLSDRFSVPTELLDAIVKSVLANLRGMDEQGLSNSLWACAKLKDIALAVLQVVPCITVQIQAKAKDMIPQQLSNSLWASAQLKDVAPDVLKAVPAIAARIPNKAKDMVPQGLSNCLWATSKLKDDAPAVLEVVPAIAAQIPNKVKDMIPQDLSNSLWASSQLRKFWRQCRQLLHRYLTEPKT